MRLVFTGSASWRITPRDGVWKVFGVVMFVTAGLSKSSKSFLSALSAHGTIHPSSDACTNESGNDRERIGKSKRLGEKKAWLWAPGVLN